MGLFDKIDNVSGSNIIRKVLHLRNGKMFVMSASCLHEYSKKKSKYYMHH